MENYFGDVDGVEEVLNEEQQPVEVEADAYISDALLRIEQAQLYKQLINHRLFAPGSASPNIQEAVEREVREFAIHRLEVLVGAKPDVQAAQQLFTEEEVAALKSLANRVINRPTTMSPQGASPIPKLNEVAPREPQINPVPAPNQVSKPPTRQAVQPHNGTERKPAPKRTRKKSENVSTITGQDLSQATPTGNSQPKRMPNIAETNRILAAQVEKSVASMATSERGNVLMKAIGASQEKNKNIQED